MEKLIIVCDEKREKFGNYLFQLISRKDDTEENTVGIKDGSVTAALWLEKDYIANRPKLQPNQHVLFIGNSKYLKEKRCNMSVDFSKYGMKYGSLGTQAFIVVEKVVNRIEYQEFYEYAKKYAENLDKIINFDKDKKGLIGMGATTVGTATAAAATGVGLATGAALFSPLISVPI